MVRKRVQALVSLMTFVPVAGWGLGLGDIHLHSALNQPLKAEIDLLSVNPGDLDNLDVALASYETFARLGLERTSELMLLRFSVEERNGRPYITVTSPKPIREPFLDFLLEVTWRQGRLLREYTLLLDPPDVVKEAAPSVAAPAVTAARAPAAKAAPVSGQPGSAAPTSAPRGSSGAPAARKGELVYGPVKADDTLWSIARNMRPDASVSVQQMMMALYKANPDAFVDNNVNGLKKGQVLRVDDPRLLTALSKAEAEREVRYQSRVWQDLKTRAAAGAGTRTATGEAPAAAPAGAGAPEGAKLKLVAPEEDEGTLKDGAVPGVSGKGDIEAVRQDLTVAQEAAKVQQRENQELRARVRELEEQLERMQRLISLKDNDLAAVQEQLRAQASAETAAAREARPLTAPAAAETTAQQAPEPKPAAEPKPAPTPAAPPKVAEPQKPVEAKQPAPPKPKPAPQPAPEPGFVDTVLQNPGLYGGGAGAVLLVALLFGWLIRRRRAAAGFQESILTGGTSSMLAAGNEEGRSSVESSFLSDLTVSGMGAVQEESEVDPLTEADVYMAYGRFQQAEELLKEALSHTPDRPEVLVKLLEVYHQSRNRAAFEGLVKEAISKVEGNETLWNKVLTMGHELAPENPLFAEAPKGGEVSVSSGNGTKSDHIMDDVFDIGLDLDELAAEMEGAGEPGAGASSVGGEEFDMDIGLDLGFESEAEKAGTPVSGRAEQKAGGSEGLDLDFDLDLGGDEEPSASALQSSAPAEGPFSLESELDESAFSMGGEQAEGQGEEEAGGELDFDFELPGDERATSELGEEADEFPVADLEMLGGEESPKGDDEFDFGDLSLGSDDSESEFSMETKTEESLEETFSLDDLDLGEIEAPEPEAAGASPGSADVSGDLDLAALDMDFGADDLLGGLDEVATKLDLAKAYVEMGDNEGAKDMLEEVLSEGDEEQQARAKELLEKIGA